MGGGVAIHPNFALLVICDFPMKNKLKMLRAEHNWTQEELAKRVGVSRQAINALETGKHDPSLDLAYRIASSFQVSVEKIFQNPHTPN